MLLLILTDDKLHEVKDVRASKRKIRSSCVFQLHISLSSARAILN